MNTIPYDELQQENTKLRQQVAYLQQQLSPPAPPARELKYWIVTWLDRWSLGFKFESEAIAEWPNVLKRKDELKSKPNVSHIRILEQIVFV